MPAQTEYRNGDLHAHQRIMLELLKAFDAVCTQYDLQYTLFAGTLLGAVRHQGFIPWDDDLDVIMPRQDFDRLQQLGQSAFGSGLYTFQTVFSEHWPMFFSKLRMDGTACMEKIRPTDRQMHQGIYIDIFPCDNASDHMLVRRLQFLASKVVIAKSLYRRGYETDSLKKKCFLAFCRLLPTRPFLRLCKLRSAGSSRWVHAFLGAASQMEKSVFPRDVFSARTEAKFEDGMFPVPEKSDVLLTILYGDYMQLPPPEARRCKVHAFLIDTEGSWEPYFDLQANIKFDEYTRSIR